MLTTEKAPIATISRPVSYNLPTELIGLVIEDAEADDRSASYVVTQILKAHYAKRIGLRQKKAA